MGGAAKEMGRAVRYLLCQHILNHIIFPHCQHIFKESRQWEIFTNLRAKLIAEELTSQVWGGVVMWAWLHWHMAMMLLFCRTPLCLLT